jgi:glycosyltransferase involved in cell wall biosynthesis
MRGHIGRLAWLQTVMHVRVRAAALRVLLNTVPEGVLGLPIPQVAVVHDLLPLRFPPEYPRQQYYFRYFVPRILRSSRTVIADSEFTYRDIAVHYGIAPAKVQVIHPGYDAKVFSPNRTTPPRSTDEPCFLYVGNLLPHKNLLRLLDALAIVRRRRPCRLVIRGEGRPAYVAQLRERIATLGLGHTVTFLGYVTEQRLRELYARATCLVFPSLGEGFGLPVLEAMACGTPVIAANASSLPEVAGEAALMIDPNDAVALADAMYRVGANAALRSDLRRRGLERVQLFSWRRTAEAVSAMLDAALV